MDQEKQLENSVAISEPSMAKKYGRRIYKTFGFFFVFLVIYFISLYFIPGRSCGRDALLCAPPFFLQILIVSAGFALLLLFYVAKFFYYSFFEAKANSLDRIIKLGLLIFILFLSFIVAIIIITQIFYFFDPSLN